MATPSTRQMERGRTAHVPSMIRGGGRSRQPRSTSGPRASREMRAQSYPPGHDRQPIRSSPRTRLACESMPVDVLDLELVPPHPEHRVTSDPLDLQPRRGPNRAPCSTLRIEHHPVPRAIWLEVVHLRPQPAKLVELEGLEGREGIGDADLVVDAVPGVPGRQPVQLPPIRPSIVSRGVQHGVDSHQPACRRVVPHQLLFELHHPLLWKRCSGTRSAPDRRTTH